jgi:hypothetical protein
MKLNLNTPFDITKIGQRVFQVGKFEISSKLINFIDQGLSFVPIFSRIDLFYFLFNFYNSINDLNRSIIFKDTKKNKGSNIQTIVKNNCDSLISYLKKSYPNKTSPFVHNLSKDFHLKFLSNFLSNFKQLNFNTQIKEIRKVLLEIKNWLLVKLIRILVLL